jgi:hypothetical protein
MNTRRLSFLSLGLLATTLPLIAHAATPPLVQGLARPLLLERLDGAHERSLRIFLGRALDRYVAVGWEGVNHAGEAEDPLAALQEVATTQSYTSESFWTTGIEEARRARKYYDTRWKRWRTEVTDQLLKTTAEQGDYTSPEILARDAMNLLPEESWPGSRAIPPLEKFRLGPGRPPAPVLTDPQMNQEGPPQAESRPNPGLDLGDEDFGPSPNEATRIPSEEAPEPAQEAFPDEPSGSYTVQNGEGMGHVARAFRELLKEAHPDKPFPDIWVPQEGGRIGLPHVLACANGKEPGDWGLWVGQVLKFPAIGQVWPLAEFIKDSGHCPQGALPSRIPSARDILRQKPPLGEDDPIEQSLAPGNSVRVRSGKTYSHYAIGVDRELRKRLRSDQIPSLYPPPGRHGLMNVLACWNTGEAENFRLRPGQILSVPTEGFLAVVKYLDGHEGSCPEEFRKPTESEE